LCVPLRPSPFVSLHPSKFVSLLSLGDEEGEFPLLEGELAVLGLSVGVLSVKIPKEKKLLLSFSDSLQTLFSRFLQWCVITKYLHF
jgi:hypothetical protein